jgi:hypothetical protein
MASFSSQAFSFGPTNNHDTIKNMGQISPMVQRHLKLVYLTMCCALASSAVGAYLHVMLNIGGLLTFIGGILSIGWLFSVPIFDEVHTLNIIFCNGRSGYRLISTLVTIFFNLINLILC